MFLGINDSIEVDSTSITALFELFACLSHHPLVVLSIDGDCCLFDDSVCDLMEVTKYIPAFVSLFLFLFSIQLVLL